MPLFGKDDFTPDNATRLNVIIMKQMGRNPTIAFKDLPPSQKVKFNRILNEYIASLGEDWGTKLMNDFNRIVNEDILNEEFDPSKIMVSRLNTEREILFSAEQKDWEKEQIALGETPRY